MRYRGSTRRSVSVHVRFLLKSNNPAKQKKNALTESGGGAGGGAGAEVGGVCVLCAVCFDVQQ